MSTVVIGAAPPVHAWMPRSPCDARCLPPSPPTVPPALRTLRALALVLVAVLTLVLSLVAVLVPVVRPRVQSGAARWALRACGVRLRVHGGPRWAAPGTGVLVVAEHVSWLDALALPAVQPLSLVSRADLAGWPVVGLAARRARTVFLDRERLRTLPDTVAEVATELRRGRTMAAFPEGTTWCGTARGGFRPAMFQAAVDAGVGVRPVALRYLLRDGATTTSPAFIGDETFPQGLWRVLGLRGVVLELTLLAVQAPGHDRHELAARCADAVAAVRRPGLPPLRLLDGPRSPAHQVSASPPSVASCLRTMSQSPQGSSSRPSLPSGASG